ncbi:MAG TPA: hypothetical protein VGW35_10690 [Methylomirabilota bacterium]|jgi:hypothetical protein|nr:hypothetical protein [Methylomirabilota bacterium]
MLAVGRALIALLVLWPAAAAAEVQLPPGFTAQVYVAGEGFDAGTTRGARGIPASSTLAVDQAGVLYLARTGRRYLGAIGGEGDDLWPLYRIPLGGARLGPGTEARYFHGPPLRNPQVAAIRGGRELFVTTFDRDRMLGVLYRMVDGRAELFAGGTPARGVPPVLRQPEGAAVDAAGNLFVADRERGLVVRLDPNGRILEPHYVAVTRPRVLAVDERDHLWIGSDANAEAPWQPGPGEIWRVSPQGVPSLLLRGPVPAGIGLSPGGTLFVADRHGAQVFAVTPEGTRLPFASFTDGDAPRGLGFVPITPDTRRGGIAGDLLVIAIIRGAWPLNEVIRISGPFDEFVRRHHASTP